jgi:hypothetical protein
MPRGDDITNNPQTSDTTSYLQMAQPAAFDDDAWCSAPAERLKATGARPSQQLAADFEVRHGYCCYVLCMQHVSVHDAGLLLGLVACRCSWTDQTYTEPCFGIYCQQCTAMMLVSATNIMHRQPAVSG